MLDVVGVVPPLLCFGLLLLTLRRRADDTHMIDRRTSWLAACVVWGVAVVLITELLGVLELLHRPFVFAAWAALSVVLATWTLLRVRRHGSRKDSPDSSPARHLWRPDAALDRVLLLGVVLAAAILGFLALLAPPNNWDSMAYHMSRVVHWIQNGSVAHYPTAIDRQLYLAPWAEFAILQFQVLTGGDRWANMVQWMSMVGSVLGGSVIAKQLGGNVSAQLAASVVVISIPMGILQASSTQTDYVTAFWLVCFAHGALLLTGSGTLRHVGFITVLTGASLGLAVLTKGTTYTFALPFGAWLLFWSARRPTVRRFAILAVIALVALSLNVAHFVRNGTTFGHPLGAPETLRSIRNEIMTPAIVMSNGVRNFALHLSVPSRTVNGAALHLVERVHAFIGVDMNDARTSFGGGKPPDQFDMRWPRPHEDLAGNGLHVVLLALSTVVMLARSRDAESGRRAGYALALLVAFSLFCVTFKWQPGGSRLQLPLFVLGAPLIALMLARLLRPNHARVVGVLLLIAAVPWIVFNESRPLIARRIGGPLQSVEARTVLDTPRLDLYFRNRPELAAPYQATAKRLQQANCRNVGLIIGGDDWEYPFWVLSSAEGVTPPRLSHIVSANQESMVQLMSRPQTLNHCAVIFIDDADGNAMRTVERRYDQRWRMAPVTLFTHLRDVP